MSGSVWLPPVCVFTTNSGPSGVPSALMIRQKTAVPETSPPVALLVSVQTTANLPSERALTFDSIWGTMRGSFIGSWMPDRTGVVMVAVSVK
jgi:hypothetical protein